MILFLFISPELVNNEALDKTTADNLDLFKDISPSSKTENEKNPNNEVDNPNEKEDIQDDDEMIQLRMNLLNNLNEKRTIKKQKQLELEQEQVKQFDEDISIFKKKLIEHEQELLIDEIKEQNKKILNATATSFKTTNKNPTQTSSTGTSSLNNLKNSIKSLTPNDALPKISPVIIHLNSNETESDDEFMVSETTHSNASKQLESNIDLFLKEAKILAELKSTYENRKRAALNSSTVTNLNLVTSNLTQNANFTIESKNVVESIPDGDENSNDCNSNKDKMPKSKTRSDNENENRNNLSEQQQKTEKDKEKKNIIKSLRDRINLKRFFFI